MQKGAGSGGLGLPPSLGFPQRWGGWGRVRGHPPLPQPPRLWAFTSSACGPCWGAGGEDGEKRPKGPSAICPRWAEAAGTAGPPLPPQQVLRRGRPGTHPTQVLIRFMWRVQPTPHLGHGPLAPCRTSTPWLLGQRGAVLPRSPSQRVSAEGREAREKALPSLSGSVPSTRRTHTRQVSARARALWAGALQDRGAGACSRLGPPQAGTAPSALGVRRGVDGVSLFPGWLRLLCQRSLLWGRRHRRPPPTG